MRCSCCSGTGQHIVQKYNKYTGVEWGVRICTQCKGIGVVCNEVENEV